MAFLLLSALSSVIIAIGFRYASSLGGKVQNILVVNYITASLFLLPQVLESGFLIHEYSTPVLALLIVIGVLFVINFFLYSKCLSENGVGGTVTISRLSVVWPVILGLFYFKEEISLFQKAGIGLTVVLFLVLMKRKDVFQEIKKPFLLSLLFLLSGLGDSLVSVLNANIQLELKQQSASLIFLVAVPVSALFSLTNPISWTKIDVFLGIVIGIANFGSLFYLLEGLGTKASAVAFPLVNTLIIVLSVIGGTLIFSEPMNKRKIMATISAVATIIFLNLSS